MKADLIKLLEHYEHALDVCEESLLEDQIKWCFKLNVHLGMCHSALLIGVNIDDDMPESLDFYDIHGYMFETVKNKGAFYGNPTYCLQVRINWMKETLKIKYDYETSTGNNKEPELTEV